MSRKGQGEMLVIIVVGVVLLLIFGVGFYYVMTTDVLDANNGTIQTTEVLTPNIPTVASGSNPDSPSTPIVAPKGGCREGIVPDSRCTPGTIFANATKEVICVTGYTNTVRNVPEDLRQAVFSRYNIVENTHSNYEIDHLIPLELGGDNSIDNLWPEAYDGTYGAREKDVVENSLHRKVCEGTLSLQRAQEIMRINWMYNGE